MASLGSVIIYYVFPHSLLISLFSCVLKQRSVTMVFECGKKVDAADVLGCITADHEHLHQFMKSCSYNR